MNNSLKILVAGILFASIFFAVTAFDQEAFINKLNEYKLLPQPEPFTELYFEDHLKLPKSFLENKDNAFKFTVHNLEYKTFTYDYFIKAIATDSARTISKGSFVLKHDEYKTIKEKISTQEAIRRSKINVSLDNKNQSIHFWVN